MRDRVPADEEYLGVPLATDSVEAHERRATIVLGQLGRQLHEAPPLLTTNLLLAWSRHTLDRATLPRRLDHLGMRQIHPQDHEPLVRSRTRQPVRLVVGAGRLGLQVDRETAVRICDEPLR